MIRTTRSLGACAVLALAACGGEGPGATGSGPSGVRQAPGEGVVTAADVAREARGKVRCPAKIATPPRPAAAPVDDVQGVRPGLTYDEAANLVLCSHDLLVVAEDRSRGFQIETHGQPLRQGFGARFAKPRDERPKSSEDYLAEMGAAAAARSGNAVVRDMEPGQAKWFVGTLGLPGEDRVISVAREEWFEQGRNPTMASVEQALVAKYGSPTRAADAGPNRNVYWSFDPSGRRLDEPGECLGSASPDSGAVISPDCGVAVAATLFALPDNPAVAEYFQVGVVDQARGWQRMTALREALDAAEGRRRAQQVADAAKNAPAPKL